jgi:hypothetical protein
VVGSRQNAARLAFSPDFSAYDVFVSYSNEPIDCGSAVAAPGRDVV